MTHWIPLSQSKFGQRRKNPPRRRCPECKNTVYVDVAGSMLRDHDLQGRLLLRDVDDQGEPCPGSRTPVHWKT